MYNLSMNAQKFGEYIKTRREYLQLTRNDVATFTHISPGHVYNIEKGLRIPPPELIIELAKILETTSADLITVLEDNPNNEETVNRQFFIKLPKYFSQKDYEFILSTIDFISVTYKEGRIKQNDWFDGEKEAG